MSIEPYFAEHLKSMLECLGFVAKSFIGDKDQIKFSHSERPRLASRRNWLTLPRVPVASHRLAIRVISDLQENFGFTEKEIFDCAPNK